MSIIDCDHFTVSSLMMKEMTHEEDEGYAMFKITYKAQPHLLESAYLNPREGRTEVSQFYQPRDPTNFASKEAIQLYYLQRNFCYSFHSYLHIIASQVSKISVNKS